MDPLSVVLLIAAFALIASVILGMPRLVARVRDLVDSLVTRRRSRDDDPLS